MANPTIDATPGGASANSYATLAVADQFHLERVPVGSTWADAENKDKSAALIYATRLLDALYEWEGFVVTAEQALLWPRQGMLYRNGYNVPVTVVPVELQRATAEFARQLMVSDRTADNDLATQGIRSLTAGPISLTFDGSARPASSTAVPDIVRSMIPTDWGRVRGTSSVICLERV